MLVDTHSVDRRQDRPVEEARSRCLKMGEGIDADLTWPRRRGTC
jgi:hypothetical protein